MFARVEDGKVVEIIDLESIEGVFHPEVAKTLHKTDPSVRVGWSYGGGKFSAPQAEGIAASHSAAIISIDEAAETARLRYLTAGVGQALTYQAKVDEVRRYELDTNPIKANYPFLSAEIGVTGSSLAAVVDVVSAALKVWTEKGAEIERVRLKAKADVAKAETPEKITDIVSGIDWP